jgi:hypothetical protein
VICSERTHGADYVFSTWLSRSDPMGGGRAAWFELSCNLHNGQWTGVFLGVHMCKRMHTSLHAFGFERAAVQAIPRAYTLPSPCPLLYR